MSEKKYFCLCGSNCKYETMTKEQIIDALAAATPAAHIEDGVLYLTLDGGADVGEDAAFITQIREGNAGGNVSVWVGTEAEFNALSPAVKADAFVARIDESGKVYVCKDDSFMQLLKKAIHTDHIVVGNTVLNEQTVADMNSKDWVAGAVKQAQGADADYVDKPVQMCYQTKNPPALAAGSQLAIWKDKGNGVAEIQPVSMQAVRDWMDEHLSIGVRREFHKTDGGSWKLSYYIEGRKSKFYVITIGDYSKSNLTGNTRRPHITVTIDFKGIHVAEDGSSALFQYPYVRPDGTLTYFNISVSGSQEMNYITFDLTGPGATTEEGKAALGITDICGYY